MMPLAGWVPYREEDAEKYNYGEIAILSNADI